MLLNVFKRKCREQGIARASTEAAQVMQVKLLTKNFSGASFPYRHDLSPASDAL